MVLTKEQLDEVMNPQEQKEEIERIKNAPECMVLYETNMADQKSASICETLLKISECDYHESMWLSRGIIKWVKGHIRMHFEMA